MFGIFQKDRKQHLNLIDFRNKVNGITPAYLLKLGFWVQKTNIGASKIDESILATFEIVIIGLQFQNNLESAKFFQKTILVANTSMEVIFGMFFFIFSNDYIGFVDITFI